MGLRGEAGASRAGGLSAAVVIGLRGGLWDTESSGARDVGLIRLEGGKLQGVKAEADSADKVWAEVGGLTLGVGLLRLSLDPRER